MAEKRPLDVDSETETQPSLRQPNSADRKTQATKKSKSWAPKGFGACSICGQTNAGYLCSRDKCANIVCCGPKNSQCCLPSTKVEAPFSCNNCFRKEKALLQGTRATVREGRGMPNGDFEPLLVIGLIPEEDIEIEDPQVANIDLMCQLHYQSHPQVTKVYRFIRIKTSKKVNRSDSDDILEFLNADLKTRVLVIINMHSRPDNGRIQYAGLQQDYTSNKVVKQLMTHPAEKGLMLLACGGVIACDESREDLMKHILEPKVFRFVLGFPASGLIPQHVEIQCNDFVSACFLWKLMGLSQSLDHEPTRARHARDWAFAADMTSNMHTGAALIERLGDGNLSSTEFRRGVPTLLPFGLPVMACPFCKNSYKVELQRVDHIRLDMTCNGCKASAKRVDQPQGVDKVDHKGIGDGHYCFPFPFKSEEEVLWCLGKEERFQSWNSIPQHLRLNHSIETPPQP
ncbi:hypothetical protein M407DRAFT_24517 [Tulasnella calospora MUT 4182]|uniref:Uncharacterized protein n=1 Tax=Tulasnella calospora MUT 4182 TaxID=1051891 RepID=A0A0C3QJ86_9AGAM|nr:hypothetical protein M407DRAFT_24517 [Tulasnella calospora MUT 4182]